MSEKNLKSLRFHGLDDIYKIPSTAEDVGAATLEQVNQAMRKAAPRNLLDNSDFRNPVNQRGGYYAKSGITYYTDTGLTTVKGTLSVATTANYVNGTYGSVSVSGTTYYIKYTDMVNGYLGARYGIDRWKGDSNDAVITLLGNGITVMGDHLDQIIPNSLSYANKVLTFALCDSVGNIEVISTLIPAENDKSKWLIQAGKQFDFGFWIEKKGDIYACFKNAESSNPIVWAAVYEGEYILETLPEYQPKGYGVELAECLRYYQKLLGKNAKTAYAAYPFEVTDSGAYAVVTIPFMTQMRANPSINKEIQMTVVHKNQAGATLRGSLGDVSVHEVSTEYITIKVATTMTTTGVYMYVSSPTDNFAVSADL